MNLRSLSGGNVPGTHKVEGIGAGFVTSICRLDLADEIIAVSDEDTDETAKRLERLEGTIKILNFLYPDL